ncbi:hypothetical protein [uncultured Methanobrevibacter sp.]|uniref:hypothetical protein n=1 Tax=uncultured Methanobrevibacter sp. TaxID=253161 RepID=UPI0025CBB0AB|nr:hypothetical protein [uncultured Methanobrevibacter sp.]
MFDIEEVGVLLSDVGENSPSFSFIDLDLNSETFNENKDILFISAFAYTLSRFVCSDKVLFDIIDENSDPLPLFVNCENQKVSAFIDSVKESIDYYDQNRVDESSNIVFNLMSEEIESYDFNANILQKDKDYVLKLSSSEKYSQNTINRFLYSFKSILHDILNVDVLKDMIIPVFLI